MSYFAGLLISNPCNNQGDDESEAQGESNFGLKDLGGEVSGGEDEDQAGVEDNRMVRMIMMIAVINRLMKIKVESKGQVQLMMRT